MPRKLVDSGVAWIGKIPEGGGWKTLRFKHCIDDSNAGEVIDKTWWNDGDELLFTCQRTPMKSSFRDFPDWKRTSVGDLLLTRNGTPYGFIPPNGAIYSNVVQRVKLKETYLTKFIKEALLLGVNQFVANGDTIPSYNMQMWGDVPLPIPPLDEQKRIAAFLDEKCAKIDALRGKIETQIEKLDELKKSTITEAVTKGLKRGRKMKPSGVEWIGDVPEGWKVSRIKYEVETRNEVELYDPESDVYIGLENLQPFSSCIIPSDTTYPASRYSLCQKNDLLFSKLRPYLAKCIISPCNAFCTGEFVVINSFSGIVAFLRYWLLADNVLSQIVASTYGAKMPRASESFILNLPIILPPLAEQKEIAEYLDKKCAAIDAAKEKCRAELEKLAEYKKSLIYEYVTGKRSVYAKATP